MFAPERNGILGAFREEKGRGPLKVFNEKKFATKIFPKLN